VLPAGGVSGDGKIAVLGGIQINTPPSFSDYYLPLSFDLYDNMSAHSPRYLRCSLVRLRMPN